MRRIYLSYLEGDEQPGGIPKLLLKETGLNSGFGYSTITTACFSFRNKGTLPFRFIR